MSEDKTPLASFETGNEKIRAGVIAPEEELKEKPYLALGLIALLVVVAVVLIFLPSKPTIPHSNQAEAPSVEELEDSGISSAEASASPVTASSPPAALEDSAESPWAESQQQNARRDTQEILSELLDIQEELERLRADQWAATDIENIQGLAASGDESYRARAYDEALQLYASALDAAKQVVVSAPEKATEYYSLGVDALEENKTEIAITYLEMASLLDPDHLEAAGALDQANVRDEVLVLEKAALKQAEEGFLEQARDSFIEIQKLDSNYADIDKQIAGMEVQILDRDFRDAMSSGFVSLANGALASAESAFNRAGSLKPGNSAVTEALQQVEASRINVDRQSKIDRAIALEAQERWAEALKIYTGLEAEDATLTSAQLGKIRTDARSDLDTKIKNILNEPLKLQSEKIWQQATQVLIDAKNVIDRGPILSEQIDRLDSVIRIARTKVTVALYSDSQTNIEIYRMGELGQFREHAVALYPGRYVVVGTRSGYRDIREELILDGSQARVELDIQCVETI